MLNLLFQHFNRHAHEVLSRCGLKMFLKPVSGFKNIFNMDLIGILNHWSAGKADLA